MRSHREMYPEQYRHPLVGKTVRTPDGETGQVLRVFNIRFGLAAVTSLDPEGKTAWLVASLVLLCEWCGRERPPDQSSCGCFE